MIDQKKSKGEKYSSVKDVLHSLISQSSLHGFPRILSSTHWYQKILWTILVCVTCGFLVYQLYQLFYEFNNYPTKTKVSIKRGTLQFPAVSICNMNPVKNSSLALIDGTEFYKVMTLDPNEISVDIEVTYDQNLENNNSSDSFDLNEHNSKSDYEYYYNPETNNGSSGDYENYDNDFSWANDITFSVDGSNIQQSLDDFANYIKSLNSWEDDEWSEDVKKFRTLFQNQSKETRKSLGHSIQDMLLTCAINGKKCSAENFTLFQTLDYGNCYTLTNDLFVTRRTGPLNGLQMILQLEKFEHIEHYVDGSGFRLVLHEPGTFPFPVAEGFTLSAGYETTIGMKMEQVTRAGPPYGTCEEGDNFFKTYGIRYTTTACLHVCRNRKVMEICKCRPSETIVDIKFMDIYITLPVCAALVNDSLRKDNKMKQCEEFIYYEIEENHINCGCATPCRQTLYQFTSSGRVWPAESFLRDELLDAMCRNQNHSHCIQFMEGNFDFHYKDNFLKLVIYYEDLNFEELTEEPLYDGFRFLSDIGGTMGLFLGASLLSFVEIIQLLVELLNYLRRKCFKNKNSSIFVESTKDTTVVDNIHAFTMTNDKRDKV
ncbi:degenerin deg-1-like [Ostrea edulis]|uniref:degenerin deg-1-like n=1 Tax=Ostrea edulis TaxID=37623 RepID=UPI0024AFF144|nr:degenerin deg-1-like [Ostrea edulis]